MECGHCGASNSERAKFCGKCAVRLRASATAEYIKRPVLAARQEDIDKTVQLRFEPVRADRDSILASSVTVAPPLAATTPPVPKAFGRPSGVVDSRSLRTLAIFGAAALLIAAVGTAGYRHFHDVKSAGAETAPVANIKAPELIAPVAVAGQGVAITAQGGVAVPAPAPASASVPDVPKPVIGSDSVMRKSVVEPSTASSQTRVNKVEKVTVQHATPVKRKSETASAHKAATSHTIRHEEIASSRAIGPKSSQAEITRLARSKILPAAVQQTPQQACADRSNFISRGICESRECEKPEHLSLKFCVDMRARRAPREFPN